MIIGKIISPFLLLACRIISILIYLATILAAFGGDINPDYLTFPSLLSLVFPYLAILTIIITVAWGVGRKIIPCGLGIATIIICLTPLSDAFPIAYSRNPESGKQTFKIISWNVLHTKDIRQPEYKGNRAVEFMINSGADVICLAELFNFEPSELINSTLSERDSLFKMYPYRVGLTSNDIKVLSKYPASRIEKIHTDCEGRCRFDFFKIELPDHPLVVGVVHLYSYGLSPEERQVISEINSVETAKTSMKELEGSIFNKMRIAFRKRAEDAGMLRKVINEIPKDIPLIVCGDFNDVPTSWTYKIVRGDDLKDAYSETNFGPAITYNLHGFYFHIDQMLYRGPIKALNLNVNKINSSDHYPLVAEFEFTN